MKNAKKFMGLAMVLLMVLSLAPTAAYADNTGNLLTNGGFETEPTTEWEYASNNSRYSSTLNENAFIVKATDGAPVHSGNNALQLVTDGTGRWFSQKVEGLTPGKAYRASAWVNINGTLTDGLFLGVAQTKTEAAAGCMAASNGVSRADGLLLTTTGGVWKNLDCAFVPTVEMDGDEVTYDATFAHIILEFGANEALIDTSAVSVYIDDVVLEEIPDDINGTFEDTTTYTNEVGTSTVWAKGWSTVGAGDGQYEATIGKYAYVEANAGRDGTNALCLTTQGEKYSNKYRQLHVYAPVTGLEPGRAYKLQGYAKTSLTGSTTQALFNVLKNESVQNRLHKGWGSDTHTVAFKNQTLTTEWAAVSCVFTAEDTYAFIGLSARAAENETVYFDDLTIEETNIKFTNAGGTVLGETLAAAGTVNAKATVVGAAGDVARMIVGVYDTVNDTPCLAEVYVSASITLGNTKWKEITIENISLSAGQYAKAVLLDSAAGLKPLTEAKILTVESAS